MLLSSLLKPRAAIMLCIVTFRVWEQWWQCLWIEFTEFMVWKHDLLWYSFFATEITPSRSQLISTLTLSMLLSLTSWLQLACQNTLYKNSQKSWSRQTWTTGTRPQGPARLIWLDRKPIRASFSTGKVATKLPLVARITQLLDTIGAYAFPILLTKYDTFSLKCTRNRLAAGLCPDMLEEHELL